MKKFISILLAMLIAAGLFVPAMAEGEETPLQDTPLLVYISGNDTDTKKIARGKTIVLEASFTPPEGFEGEPSIEWIVKNQVVGTGRKLELTIDKNEGDQWNPYVSVYVSVKVTYTSTDENGEVRTKEGIGDTAIQIAQKFVPKVLQGALIVLLFPVAMILPALMASGLLFGGIWDWITGIPQWLWSMITSIFN